ncbi:MAG: VWA domain-containing protein [Vicinamibacterales bacterium]
MRRGSAVLLTTVFVASGPAPSAQERLERPIFRSAVEMVSMAAVVRDKRGRVVPSLSREDFEVLDSGRRRSIVDLRSERSAPASVALLIDGSGSMTVGRTLDAARAVAADMLNVLDPKRDEAALFTFDKDLIELQDFTQDFDPIRIRLEDLESYGTTSLYDAIAGTARRIARFARHRRAIVVLTDGADTSSLMSPAEVSGLASSIDVPVYVLALHGANLANRAPLADLARWTGGDFLPAQDRTQAVAAVRQVAQELRHQYVLAFEPAASSGWRRVEVRTRRPGLTVRTRSWYLAGAGSSN